MRHLASHQVGGLEEDTTQPCRTPTTSAGRSGSTVTPSTHSGTPGEAAVHPVTEQLGQRLDQVAHRLGRVQVDQESPPRARSGRRPPSGSAAPLHPVLVRSGQSASMLSAPSEGRQDAPFAR